MSIPVTNFGKVTVSTGYDAAATSIALTTGHGSRLPSTFPYPLVWWNSTDYADPADDPNREIVSVTARSGDTLTVTRGAESTGASTKNTSGKTYKMVLSFTKAMYDAILGLSLSQDFRGLTLQTHPDNTVAAYKVRLTHADAIVMSDGQEVDNWDDLDADMTATGAGGLDTGTEQNSTWYSVYAIRQSASDTRALMLHRAKNYTATWTSNTGGNTAATLRYSTTYTKIAQGVTPSTAGVVPFIDVQLNKTGTPTGNYWFTLETNNGGVPSGTVLATSDKYDVARLTTTYTWIRVPFRVPASLSASTQYHVVLQGDFTISTTNYMNWYYNNAGAVTGGNEASYNGTTWTANSGYDCMLILYAEANDTALTLPTGYDQYALVGWVYNNSSGNFKHFWQKDRTVFCGYDADWKVGQMTATVSLFSLDAFVPPIPVLLSGIVYAGTGAHYAVGHLTAMDVDATATNTKVGAVRGYVGSGETYASAQVMIDYSAMMTVAGSGTDLYVDTYTW